MENERKSRGIVIALLCAVIIFMSIGFAALSSRLTVNAGATIGDTWNVQITGITQKSATDGVTETKSVSYTATTATFDVSLKEPGDNAVYTVTVKNSGSLDATLTKITETLGEGPEAIKYTVTPAENSVEGSTLAKTDGTHTFDVKVEYDASAIGEDAPAAGASKSLTIVLDYNQKV